MIKKSLLSNPTIYKEVIRQLKGINDKKLNELIKHRIIDKIGQVKDDKKQEHFIQHLFTILKKIQLLNLNESVLESIHNIIKEKYDALEHKKIKSVHLFLRAVEKAIADLNLQGLKMKEDLAESSEKINKKGNKEDMESEEKENEEAEEEFDDEYDEEESEESEEELEDDEEIEGSEALEEEGSEEEEELNEEREQDEGGENKEELEDDEAMEKSEELEDERSEDAEELDEDHEQDEEYEKTEEEESGEKLENEHNENKSQEKLGQEPGSEHLFTPLEDLYKRPPTSKSNVSLNNKEEPKLDTPK